MASAVPLVRLAVATGRPAAQVATLAVPAGARANTVPRVLPGGHAGQPTGQEQLEDLARRAIPRAGSPGGRPLAADQVAGLAGLAGRTIVRARATGRAAAGAAGRRDGSAGQGARPGRAGGATPAGRPNRADGASSGAQPGRPDASGSGSRSRRPGTGTDPDGRRRQPGAGAGSAAGQVALTAPSVGLGPRDGGTTAPMAHDPAAAGPRATTTRGPARDQDVPTSGRARHKVTRAALTGVLGLPNADPTGRAGRGPAMTRAAMTGPGTGEAGLAPGLARAATTNPGTGEAGLAPGLARAAGHRPNRHQADGTRTGLPPNPVATGRTVAGQPDLAGQQE